MALWFRLHANADGIGSFEARRVEALDLTDLAVDDAVSTYEITIDGRLVGTVRHRYGDGPWELIRKGLALAPKRTTGRALPARR
jgi:hypothetical protein